MKKFRIWSGIYVALVLLMAGAYGCQNSKDPVVKKEFSFAGTTMGTTYQVKVVTVADKAPDHLPAEIEKRLKAINQSMSTYQSDSEISRFNQMQKAGKAFPLTEDFFKVLKRGQQLYRWTGGAWDATVDPLVNLWGFGRKDQARQIPDDDTIKSMLAEVGFDQLLLTENHAIVKKTEGLTLDMGSIAKGYGVDQVAQVLKNNGFRDYLVEIGGEVYASGVRMDGKKWRVGVNRPNPGAAADAVYKVVSLQDQAMATSGDYRNFFVVGDKRYSHVIDPRTGYPVANGVISVSVIAGSCILADGLATAVMVMGHQQGLELINRLERVEALVVVKNADGGMTNYHSTGFSAEPL
jgi:thiamine biosynthesis lipoprotein